jgi:dihydroxyacetone kinase
MNDMHVTQTAQFTLGEDEVELGLGIHGEAGLLRQKLQTADTHVVSMISNKMCEVEVHHQDQLLKSILPPFEKSKYKSNKIVVLVNNLGSTTNMELSIISRRAIRALSTFSACVVIHHLFRRERL